MNRQELLEAYIDRILDNMSTKDLMRLVWDQIEESLQGYSDEELIAEVEEYYPELLEGWFLTLYPHIFTKQNGTHSRPIR